MEKQQQAPFSEGEAPGGLLLAGFGTLRPGTMKRIRDGIASAMGLAPSDPEASTEHPRDPVLVEHVPTREAALNTLGREGYRYHAFLFEQGFEDDPDHPRTFHVRMEREYPWIAAGAMARDETQIVEEAVSFYVRAPRGPPSPPFMAARRVQPLREAGPLLFSLALTDKPWWLEADAIVVPIGLSGALGMLGRAMNEAVAATPPLASMAENAARTQAFGPTSPVREELGTSADGTLPLIAIFATEGASSGTPASTERAASACLAAIRMAADIDAIRTLVLPLVGTGATSLEPDQVLRRLLTEFDPRSELGTLSHVIVVTNEESDFESLATVGASPSLVLAQELENDLPRGEDRLNVQNDVEALADSMAMRDLTPPLVVGILGGWGTGKSFALYLLKERLRRIRCWDLTDPRVHQVFPFVGHIYLVHFDAWTYAKSDLWASLMHKILADLNRQLSIEEAARQLDSEGAPLRLLKRGLDIWSLLENLNSSELEALETELGARALASLREFEPGVRAARSLSSALKLERQTERKRLAETKWEIRQVRRDFEDKREELTRKIDEIVVSAEAAVDEAVARETGTLRAQAETARADLDAAEQRIRDQVSAELEAKVREKSWTESRERLKKAFYDGIEQKLPAVAQGPAAVAALFDEIWDWKEWLSKLTPQHYLYVVAGVAGVPIVYLLVERLADSNIGATFGAAATALTGLATSIRASAQSMREKLAAEQAAFDDSLARYRAELTASSAAEAEDRLRNGTADLRRQVEEHTVALEQKTAEIRKKQKKEQATRLDELRSDREALDRRTATRIEALETRAEGQERLVGLSLTAPSLYEVIKERIEADSYDEHLGLVHRVQEDLKQISEALMPADRHDIQMFPRGEPRIVLVIDDLDRCPPSQVVQVLEAAQLLVKTRLFVVVIAMDVRYVSRSLEEHYKGVLIPDGTPSGLDYIEKIVQIPYRVPDIAPEAMRPYLERQIRLEVTDDQEQGLPPPEDEQEEQQPKDEQYAGVVFGSSLSVDAYEQLLPDTVQVFSNDELDVLNACCTAAEVSPRSAKRLVNVFKLMKIIWFHRGPDQEPGLEIKKGMLILMSLSARQPVIMREILRDLDGLLRRDRDTAEALSELLRERLLLYRDEENAKTIDYLTAVIAPGSGQPFIPATVTLESIGAENLRLVRSFSFVGETVDEIDASPPPDEPRVDEGPTGRGKPDPPKKAEDDAPPRTKRRPPAGRKTPARKTKSAKKAGTRRKAP